MDSQVSVGLLLLEIFIIGVLVLLIHVCLKYGSRFGHLESTQSIWPHASKTLLTPPKWGFALWLVYGIGFNCLTRSLLFSVLQILNVYRANEPLGMIGEFIMTCICTFVGSFVATALYKLNEGSHSILFSVALAICSIPTGITILIVRLGLNGTRIRTGEKTFMVIDEMDSVWNWVLGVMSVVAFSLLASFIVFKFINISRSVLYNYSLEKFEHQQTPSTYEESPQQGSSESKSTHEDSTKPVPSLKELIDQGSSLEDVVKTLIETRKPKQRVKQNTHTAGAALGVCLCYFVFLFLSTTLMSGIIYANTYSDGSGHGYGHEIKKVSYLATVLINLTQFMDLLSYAVFVIFVQTGFVSTGASLRNWCWYALLTNC